LLKNEKGKRKGWDFFQGKRKWWDFFKGKMKCGETKEVIESVNLLVNCTLQVPGSCVRNNGYG
jgi:hypothetical protein